MIKPDDNDVRNRIISAASECFAERGFNATSVRRICEHAGVNLAMVNYYFGSKDGLYVAIIDREGSQEKMDELMLPATDAAVPALDRLVLLIDRLATDMMATGPSALVSRLISWELVDPTPGLRHMVDKMVLPLHNAMLDLVREVSPLPMDDVEVREAVWSILGQLVYYSHSRHLNALVAPDVAYDEEGIRRIARHVTAFSLRALGVADAAHGAR